MQDVVDRYVIQSKHYLDNAFIHMRKGDCAKSGEFLWGSIAEAVKAVAASKNRWLSSHDDIRNYAMELARTLQDEGLWYAFDAAQSLHKNFYEPALKLQYVSVAADEVKRAVGKILSLIPEEKVS